MLIDLKIIQFTGISVPKLKLLFISTAGCKTSSVACFSSSRFLSAGRLYFLCVLLITIKIITVMKTIISKSVALLLFTAALLSFSTKWGGEGFEISLNGNVVLQRYGSDINSVGNLQLDQSSLNSQLSVKYHHCGKVGKNRVVTLRNWHNNVLKEWRFADASTALAPMELSVKDIFSLGKPGGSILRLYYSSTELPQGRVLANVTVGSSNAKP